jgi:hypothetical protein
MNKLWLTPLSQGVLALSGRPVQSKQYRDPVSRAGMFSEDIAFFFKNYRWQGLMFWLISS